MVKALDLENETSFEFDETESFDSPGSASFNPKAFNVFKTAKIKQYSEDLVLITGKDKLPRFSFVSTGDPCLDSLLGGFGEMAGWPRATMIEISGNESSGKTTLIYEALASFAKDFPTRGIAFIDCEGNFDSEYAKHIGVPVEEERFVYVLPQDGKQALTIVSGLLKTGMFSCIALDSWAAITPPASDKEGAEAGDGAIGYHALLGSKVLGSLATLYKKFDTTFIVANQLRVNLTPMGARGTITTGGNAMKYYPRLRMKILPIPGEGKEDLRKIVIMKAQGAAQAETSVEVAIRWGVGLDKTDSLITLGIENKTIIASGSWLQIPSLDVKVQGRAKLTQLLREDSDIRNSLCKLLNVSPFESRAVMHRKKRLTVSGLEE
jgi:recombination protein RecA